MLKVAKFGGSSVADGAQFAKVKAIVERDPDRKVIIVSAPGRRYPKDNKITDLLYLCEAHLRYGVSYDRVFEIIEQRFMDIRAYCGLNLDLDAELELIKAAMDKELPVDQLVSRGEYLNAKLMAEYLGYRFIDAKDWLSFDHTGKVDLLTSTDKLKALSGPDEPLVMPGFYGSTPEGRIKVFPRGGSDITGTLAAAILKADVCENWTDVSGILMADPKIVPEAKPISRATYAELRELSYMGADVLHEEAVFPLRRHNIPLNIRNTNRPDDPGTLIQASFADENAEEHSRFITGITGKSGFSIINIAVGSLQNQLVIIDKVINLCLKYQLPVEQLSGGVDSFSLIMPTKPLEAYRYMLLNDIQTEAEPKDLSVTDKISMIAVVGRQMAYRPGISGKVFAALGKAGINIRTIAQGADEINIMIGVDEADFERAIRLLYDSFAK